MRYNLGIDAGSTTVKLLVSEGRKTLYSSYSRHNADVARCLSGELEKLADIFPDASFGVCLTGSAGMGVAERCGFKFIQELVAESLAVKTLGFENATLIDIGGEDAKMIFFSSGRSPDIRMNGVCAGGTGAFLDQMASLLGIDAGKMGELALKAKRVYPIASRCGVFAKTDIQNLASRRISLEDISASVFHAVALQCAGSLARATDLVAPVLCVGGPLTFLGALRKAFSDVLKVSEGEMLLPENSETFAAMGAACAAEREGSLSAAEILERVEKSNFKSAKKNLEPLFKNPREFEIWKRSLSVKKIPSREIKDGEHLQVFVGIDSGSTTTKLAVMDEDLNLVFCRYGSNSGMPLEMAGKFIGEFFALAKSKGASVEILSSASTGYGEDLIRAAFNLDCGIVETMAHLQAAMWIDESVSFVLDIGGQDMKSIFVENKAVKNVELNESCSSGCGSFLQSFASMMNLDLDEFARLACLSQNPCDLGTRCTVFMNSKVKEALKEQSGAGDIAAGLAISVVKNCLFKVLKISNMERLGDNIVVQGGTFKNLAVLRALEVLSGKKISTCDRPELMGAMGAALYARSLFKKGGKSSICPNIDFSKISRKNLECRGCANRCSVIRFSFENGNVSHAGNKCERFFHSAANAKTRGEDGVLLRYKMLFENIGNSESLEKIGIPRALNVYENYPFWEELFRGCGFDLVLSGESTSSLAAKGVSFLMSDNLCFPAKLAHGHILDLVERGCKRIFFPMVAKEAGEGKGSSNSFNCSVVTGYPNVVKNSMELQSRFGVEFDYPVISFESRKSLEKSCWSYFKGLGVGRKRFLVSLENALKKREDFRRNSSLAQMKILEKGVKSRKPVLVFTGRPYHCDPLINQKASQIAADLGADVVSDDAFLFESEADLDSVNYIPQWTYPNRVMRAAIAVAKLPKNVALVQLNSFGCGPDSFLMDEASEVLHAAGKNLTVIRVDEISSTGSIRLRLRSLIESLKLFGDSSDGALEPYKPYNLSYEKIDREKTIVVPFVNDIISPIIPAMAKAMGYKAVCLPPPDSESVGDGLKYGHNEVCYPATVIVGDIIKFLKKAGRKASDYVVAITQTGGQCRATNYLALIKNAMRLAGFSNVKIVSVNFGKTFKNSQPAFKTGIIKSVKLSLLCIAFTDAVSEMYHAMRVREAVSGSAKHIADSVINRAVPLFEKCDAKGIFRLLKEAVDTFNRIVVKFESTRKIGFIGEIYLKYNSFSHCNLADWISERGVEVVRPPLKNFVMQTFVNEKANESFGISERGFFSRILSPAAFSYMNSFLARAEKIMSQFKYFHRSPTIFEMASDAEKILRLSNQFGEGWLIAAEIAEFAKRGINDVVCVQPFGCIANHIVAKGIERKVKKMFPHMNILFLDIDSSVAPVNLQNRLMFLIDENLKYTQKADA